jgi:hypothetical protein
MGAHNKNTPTIHPIGKGRPGLPTIITTSATSATSGFSLLSGQRRSNGNLCALCLHGKAGRLEATSWGGASRPYFIKTEQLFCGDSCSLVVQPIQNKHVFFLARTLLYGPLQQNDENTERLRESKRRASNASNMFNDWTNSGGEFGLGWNSLGR